MLEIRTSPNQLWQVDYHTADQLAIDGEPLAWDLAVLGDGHYHILYEGRSYNAELVEADYAAKKLVLKINGQRVELRPKTGSTCCLRKWA